MSAGAFRNYTEHDGILPRSLWRFGAVIALTMSLGIITLLVERPHVGMVVFWQLAIPILPALWLVAPGVWRNVCPMALLNQLPREFGFGLALSRPAWLRSATFPISIFALFAIVAMRPLLFDRSPLATAALIAAGLGLALAGGLVFKGKSGWCGTFCPLAPIQRLYGNAPIVTVRNEYCAPCVGCQQNCYDFNPGASLFSNLYDRDQRAAEQRRFFAAVYPGFVVGFFAATAAPGGLLAPLGLLNLAVWPLLTLGTFQALATFTRASSYALVALFGMTALALYYWFAAPVVIHALGAIAAVPLPGGSARDAQIAIASLALCSFGIGLRREREYTRIIAGASVATTGSGNAILQTIVRDEAGAEVLERTSGKRFVARPDQTLLEAIEGAGIAIESGCRMGLCGADPIAIVSGGDSLPPPSASERSTLQRIGRDGGNARLACCCRTSAPLTIDTDPRAAELTVSEAPAPVGIRHSPAALRVVVLGNGIAGTTVADHVRRRDAGASIVVVGDESRSLYNRMAITRLVYGRSAMHGLTLLPDDWYDEHRVDAWLNTRALAVDPEECTVTLATGDVLGYDRLVFATGARARHPDAPGWGIPGCFVLRSADDAIAVRAWLQHHAARNAVVLGGGPLGIEAADALRAAGMRVTIVQRGAHLMDRDLDPSGARILTTFLHGLGVDVRAGASVAAVAGNDRIRAVTLTDGSDVPCDICIACTGIEPNAALATQAGVAVRHGIIVDEQLRTSDPRIFAVGDVAELPGTTGGLWPVSLRHGEIAAANIAGDALAFTENVKTMTLKLPGIDVQSFGHIEAARNTQREICEAGAGDRSWWRVVLDDGAIVGGVFVGEPELARIALSAFREPSTCSVALGRLGGLGSAL